MPQTKDSTPWVLNYGPLIVALESLFFHWHRYPSWWRSRKRPPLHEPARPREVEQPYRIGHGHVFRFPLTRRGFVVGYWEPAGEAVLEEEESDRLIQAVEGTMVPGITADVISTWSRGYVGWWQRSLRKLVKKIQQMTMYTFSTRRDYLLHRTEDELRTQPLEPPPAAPEWDGKVYTLEDAREAANNPTAQEALAWWYTSPDSPVGIPMTPPPASPHRPPGVYVDERTITP